MTFTAHNIRLRDGTQTIPESGEMIADHPICRATFRVLEPVLGGDLTGKTIVDLACLEGGYTAAFAARGMKALGIEARQNNFVNVQIVQRTLDLPSLSLCDRRGPGAIRGTDAESCQGR